MAAGNWVPELVQIAGGVNLFGTAGEHSPWMTMDDLVSVQVFCSDVAYYADFNAVYTSYFTRDPPTRAFVGAGTLLRGARFEVMGIAVRRS